MQLGVILRKYNTLKRSLLVAKSRFLFNTILYSLKDLNAIIEPISVKF